MYKKIDSIDDYGVVFRSDLQNIKLYDEDKGYLFWAKANYVKSYQSIKLSDVISNKADYANMHLLAENIYKDTNMISIRKNKRYHPAEIKDMSAIIGLNERYTKEFIQRMIILGVIAKVIINSNEAIQVQYHVNPLYFNSNKYLSPALYMMFRKQLDKHLPNWAIERLNDR